MRPLIDSLADWQLREVLADCELSPPVALDIRNELAARKTGLTRYEVQRYRKARAQGQLPASALAAARHSVAPLLNEWPFLRHLEDAPTALAGVGDGLAVQVLVEADPFNQLGEDDVTGTFSLDREKAPGALLVEGDWDSIGAVWYHPSNYDREHADGSDLQGSKQVRREMAAERVKQAMREDAERQYLSIVAKVYNENGIEVGIASLGGVDVIPGSDASDYVIERAAELVEEAIAEAKEQAHYEPQTATDYPRINPRTLSP